MYIPIVTASILLQLAAMILALRLIRISGRRAAWVLITLGIALMAVRRIVSFIHVIGDAAPPDVYFEGIGLLTSGLMLAGVALIGPIFIELRNSGEEQTRLIGQLREAMGSIQTLRGFLPICSSCKKIRDDKGYWNQIEAYIRDHSEAEFSHGICPDCARNLYPEYFGKTAEGKG